MNDIPVDCQSQTVTEPQRDERSALQWEEEEQGSRWNFAVSKMELSVLCDDVEGYTLRKKQSRLESAPVL